TMHDRKRKLGQARRFPRGHGKKAGFLSLAFAVGGVSIEFVHRLMEHPQTGKPPRRKMKGIGEDQGDLSPQSGEQG
ncbi:hypothetical protein ACC754_42850, partial [Rhizobium johnstonii]